MFTKEEKAFLLELLDNPTVNGLIRGLVAKTMVVVIMGKLVDGTNVPHEPAQEESTIKPNEEDTNIPTPSTDTSE